MSCSLLHIEEIRIPKYKEVSKCAFLQGYIFAFTCTCNEDLKILRTAPNQYIVESIDLTTLAITNAPICTRWHVLHINQYNPILLLIELAKRNVQQCNMASFNLKKKVC